MPVRMQHLEVPRPDAWIAAREARIASSSGVGVYDGAAKDPARQSGTLVLTDRRLAYIDDAAPQAHSLQLHLGDIRRSEHYAGFLKSSPKVLLEAEVCAAIAPWACRVCAAENTDADGVCASCGAQGNTPLRSCPACTYANALTARACAMCATPLAERAALKFSFRRGGDRPFYTQLRATLQAKPWVRAEPDAAQRAPGAGIDALVASSAAVRQAQRGDMLASLADLDTLMGQASRMTALAEELRATLERGGETSDGSLLQVSLVRLGLSAPAVTPDMVRDEREYRRELALELKHILLGPLDAPGLMGVDGTDGLPQPPARGVLPLDEAWGVWNRARGVALVAPDVFRGAADMLADVTDPPLAVRTLRSGLTVLHTAYYSDARFARRVTALLGKSGLSTAEIAASERIPPLLAHELLDAAQGMRAVVRDECGGRVTWYCNAIDP